ncbi:MAG: type II toxin-antitoxin system VapC family toxin [Myxococcota bacterium]
MRTAIDTAILVDLFKADETFGEGSRRLVDEHYRLGSLSITEVVYAELAPLFDERAGLDDALRTLGVQAQAVGMEAAWLAGDRWRLYRRRGGPRNRIISDFLIGAHALRSTDVLLTRDVSFYRTNYAELALNDGLSTNG